MNAIGERRAAFVVLVLALTVAVGVVLDVIGLAPWVLIASTSATVVLVLGQRMAWIPAVAAGIVLLLAFDAVFVRVAQPIDLGLAAKNRLVLVVIATLALVVLWLLRRSLRLVRTGAARPLFFALAPLLVAAVAAVAVAAASRGTRVAWSMQNDAVWNTMMARVVWSDQGASPEHPNVSPLVQALLAGAFAPGREAVPMADLLQHDVTRQAELWLLMVFASGALAALVAWIGLRRLAPVPRALAAFVIAFLPLSWYGAGYAFQFGFFNATISLIALLCAWIGWTTAKDGRFGSIVILSGSTIVLLATWAPLGIVPIMLGIGVLAWAPRDWWRSIRRARAVGLVAALAVIPLYLLAVTLPDILRDGKGLSANGGIIAISPWHVLLVGAVALASSAWIAFRSPGRDRVPFVGVALVGVASAVALSYLMLQRSGQDSLWGYYPQKLSWLVATLLVIVIAVTLVDLAPVRPRARRGWLAVAAIVVVILICLPRPTTTVAAILASALSPAPQIVPDPTMERLFIASDPSRLNIFARYASPGEDAFANGWLLQQYAKSGQDPVRSFAYTLDGTDPVQVCALAGTKRVDLVVRTKDPELGALLSGTCPGAPMKVVVD